MTRTTTTRPAAFVLALAVVTSSWTATLAMPAQADMTAPAIAAPATAPAADLTFV